MSRGAPTKVEAVRHLKSNMTIDQIDAAKSLLVNLDFSVIMLAFKLLPECANSYCKRRAMSKHNSWCIQCRPKLVNKTSRESVVIQQIAESVEEVEAYQWD